MTDHLPECIHPQRDYPCAWCQEIYCECPCICDRLRACEQRVLNEAREAVVALPMMKIAGNFPLYDADEVIAAIDALKEKP